MNQTNTRENTQPIEGVKFARACSNCGKGMNEGYCIHGGDAYYCSDKCLDKNVTASEWRKLYSDGNTDSYFTTWDSEEDTQWITDKSGCIVPYEPQPEPVVSRLNRTELSFTKVSTNGKVGSSQKAKNIYMNLCDQAKNQQVQIAINTNPREEAKIAIIFGAEWLFEGTAAELKTILLDHTNSL